MKWNQPNQPKQPPQQPGRPRPGGPPPRPGATPPAIPAPRPAHDHGRAKAEARESNRQNLIAVRYSHARGDREVAEVEYDKLRAALRRLEDINPAGATQAWRDLSTMLRGLTERVEASLPKRRRRRG